MSAGAIQPISCVTKPRDNVLIVVEPLINACCKNLYIGVRFLDPLQAFRAGYYANDHDFARTFLLQYVDCRIS